MTKKVKKDEDFECDDGMIDEFEDIDIDEAISSSNFDVRRRLEQLREEKELERLINGKYDDLF